MPKCPKCESTRTRCTNWVERLEGNVAGSVAGFLIGMINPSLSSPEHMIVRREVCPYKKYKCDACDHEWEVKQ